MPIHIFGVECVIIGCPIKSAKYFVIKLMIDGGTEVLLKFMILIFLLLTLYYIAILIFYNKIDNNTDTTNAITIVTIVNI